MAYIMPLKFGEVDRILNVEQKVGPRDCPNLPGDVEAVQRLLAIAARAFASSHGFGLPYPTGNFDALTGFYIYDYQCHQRSKKPETVIDGCVSPAHGASYGGGFWTIVGLNELACEHDRNAWEEALSHFADNPTPESWMAGSTQRRFAQMRG